ncbi:MAG: hypothetical protein HY719_08385 [Planctomycetes bacterium]|nr:hypothetical protein [Planctomycetota bacterium]
MFRRSNRARAAVRPLACLVAAGWLMLVGGAMPAVATGQGGSPGPGPGPGEDDELVAKGEALFYAKCADCHAERPLGPLADSPAVRAGHKDLVLSREERAALRAYLKKHPRGPGSSIGEAPEEKPAPPRPAPAAGGKPAVGGGAKGRPGMYPPLPGEETSGVTALPPKAEQTPPLPRKWVFTTWKWKNEHRDWRDALDDADKMRSNDIPCGVYFIDSPWSTGYNTFDFYAPRFAQEGEKRVGEKLIKQLHERGFKVLLWITCVMNDGDKQAWDAEAERKNYQYGAERGFYANRFPIKWWKAGNGWVVDFKKPEAVKWYYSLLDKVLDMGIDGFKLDGGFPWPNYSLYFHHTALRVQQKTGNNGVTFSRPEGEAVCSATANWTGDEDPTYAGMQHAMRRVFTGIDRGFAYIGTDVGGFKGTPTKQVFLRWAQMGCFMPIMELGGGGVHEPWDFDQETVDIYRRYAWLHTDLIPFFHSLAHRAHNGEGLPMAHLNEKKEYQFVLGDAILMAPVLNDEGTRAVVLPAGLWYPLAPERREPLAGPAVHTRAYALGEAPAFVKAGSILPMRIERDVTGFGDRDSAGFLTLDIYPGPAPANADEERAYLKFYEGDQESAPATHFAWRSRGNSGRFVATGAAPGSPLVVRLRAPRAVKEVAGVVKRASPSACRKAGSGWHDDRAAQVLTVVLPKGTLAATVEFETP